MNGKKITVFLIIFCLSFTGCQNNESNVSQEMHTAVPTPANNMKTLTIYSIDSDTMSIIPVSIRKGSKRISAEYIVSLVMDNLSENQISMPAMSKKGKCLFVSFSSTGEPVQGCDKKMEHLILECFSNSLLDNLKDCSKIVFRVEGKAYKSKNYKFDLNEVYASK